MRVEVLSALGEEVVDLRDFEHLLAATPDDAYNALVCTRFACEFGRERVYQIAPDESSGPNATSREWRGKIAVADDIDPCAPVRTDGGRRGFAVEPVVNDRAPERSDTSWPTAVFAAGGGFLDLRIQGAGCSADGRRDLLIQLYQPALLSDARDGA